MQKPFGFVVDDAGWLDRLADFELQVGNRAQAERLSQWAEALREARS